MDTTRVSAYNVLDSIADIGTPDTDLAAATGFFIGVPDGAIDLLEASGGGKDTYINNIELIVHVTDGADTDTVTQQVYGISNGGAPEKLATIVWTIGDAQVDATATNLWAESAAVTVTHLKDIQKADRLSGVGSVGLDFIGYRYIYSLWTGSSGNPTTATSLYRYF
jgi:hypothetical protein